MRQVFGRRGWRSVMAVGVLGVTSIAVGTHSAGATTPPTTNVTLTIGLTQDIDSANVTVGYTVAAYEVWNLQYATLTDKAADDFHTIPGLAESWTGSDDGLSYTYKLRDGLTWSDGQPLTADDIAYTINTSRDDEWTNHFSTTQNLTATVVDPQTVTITSSVPDPKLPTMDVYIVPKHIYEKLDADALATYDGLDGVGSGPYTLTEHKVDQSWTMKANPSYWGWNGKTPPIDQLVFRIFTNGDAMASALEQGEIDAAHNLTASAFQGLEGKSGIVTVQGLQGGFDELAMNGMAGGLGDGNPALLNLDVRHAIARSIDREAIFDKVALNLGKVGSTLSVSPDLTWQPDIPEADQLTYDPDEANKLLDAAGYKDTDGDGIREDPDGNDLVLRYGQRSDSALEPAIGELVTAYLKAVGIGTTVSVYDDTQLGSQIYDGTYDLFVWGWTPFVDPDPQLSYFTCAELTTDPESPGNNDANWCDPKYDELYEAQKVELDPAKRKEIVREMIAFFYTNSTYVVLLQDPDLQAYRTDRFSGWIQQPAKTGPVLFSNTSPTYVNLVPVGSGSSKDDGTSTGLIIGLVAAGVVIVLGAVFLATRKRATADERE